MEGLIKWKSELMDNFSMAKKITIRILVKSKLLMSDDVEYTLGETAQWPGYSNSNLQLSVRSDKRNAHQITKTKLAFNVAKVVARIMKVRDSV